MCSAFIIIPVKTCLTIIDPREFKGLPRNHVEQALALFDAVSIKFLDGYKKLDLGPRTAFVKTLRKHGVEVHGWGWVRARTKAEATLEARAAAAICNALKLDAWYINSEKDWAGVEGAPRTPDPYGCLDTYITEFNAACNITRLVYNGFSWSNTSRKAGRRKLHDRDMITRLWGWCPMVYGTNPRVVAAQFPLRVNKYKIDETRVTKMAMVGCGRVAKDGAIWGRWVDDKARDVKGTKTLLLENHVEWVCFFFGNGARDQLLTGHIWHPPLIQCVRELKAA